MSTEIFSPTVEYEPVKQPGWLLVLTGPSGTGKDTVMGKLLEDPEVEATNIVTYASRPKRPNEVDGVDYHFISPEEFKEKIAQDFFAEWIPSRGAHKGTPKEPFTQISEGKNAIWRIDMSRAATVDAFYDETFEPETASMLKDRTIVVCIGVGSLYTLKTRAQGRSGENWPNDRENFKNQLVVDWRDWQNSQAVSNPFDHVILNDGAVEDTAEALKNAIFTQFGTPQE